MSEPSDKWFGSGNGRFATKVGWDGGGREWAAGGGSGTGVLGLHIPSKGRGVPKKRPAPDPSKAPKAKAVKTAKSDTKKGAAKGTGDEASGASGMNGEDLSLPGGGDVDLNVMETVGGARSGRKAGIKKMEKKALNSTPSTSPGGSGGLDLNIQQPSSLAARFRMARFPRAGRRAAPRLDQQELLSQQLRRRRRRSRRRRGHRDLSRRRIPR